MKTHIAVAGLLCLLVNACAGSASLVRSDYPQANPSSAIAPSADAAPTSRTEIPRAARPSDLWPGSPATTSPTTTSPTTTRLAATDLDRVAFRGPQEPEPPATRQYAPDHLFMQTHGDFMLKREAWRPDVRAHFGVVPDAKVKHENGDFDLRHFDADIRYPIYVNPDSYLRLGADFDHRDYDFSSNALGAHDETLHHVGLDLAYGFFLENDKDKILIEVAFQPGAYTDFSGTMHHGDWRFYSNGLATWRYDENLFFKAGIEYSGLFRHMPVYPTIGLSWIFDPQWRLDIMLPRQIRVTHDWDSNTAFFASLDLDGDQYQIRAPGPVNRARDVSVQELELTVGGHYRFDKHLSIQGRIGAVVGGDYDFRSTDPSQKYNGTLDPAAFFEIGFGYKFGR